MRSNPVSCSAANTGGDKRRAAKMLGLSHQGLINKLKRYGLEK